MSNLAKSVLPKPETGSDVKQIRIVHVINSLEPGGAETMLYRVSKGLEGERFSSKVISLAEVGPIGRRLSDLGIPVTALGMKPGRFSIGQMAALTRAIRHERPHIVMGWMVPADFLALVAGKLAGVKHVVWNIRNSGVAKKDIGARNAYLKIVGAKLSAAPSAVVMNSVAGLKSHEAIGFRPKRWEVIHNGFDLEHFQPSLEQRARERQKLGIPDDAPVVGLLAHFRPAKNHGMFFQAAQAFSRTHPNTHYVLAGQDVTDDNERIKAMAGPLWGSPYLHLLGVRDDVRPVLATLDLMALCSLWEGFPNAVGEAMAMEVPCVVTTTAGDASRIVGELGRIIEPNDVEGCVRAWAELIDDPAELARLRRESRESISERFSLDAILGQYASLFESLG